MKGQLDCKRLESVEEECGLGVNFTRDLKFSQHIAKKVNKAKSILALIKGTFEYLDNHSFSRLYTAIVRTHLEFAYVVWHPYSKTCVKWPLSKRPKSVFQDQLSLNASQKDCYHLSLRSMFCLFLSGSFTQALLYLQKDTGSLERVQMRATKLVSNLKDMPYETRLKELQLPTLSHRRLRGDIIQTFKLLKGFDGGAVAQW